MKKTANFVFLVFWFSYAGLHFASRLSVAGTAYFHVARRTQRIEHIVQNQRIAKYAVCPIDCCACCYQQPQQQLLKCWLSMVYTFFFFSVVVDTFVDNFQKEPILLSLTVALARRLTEMNEPAMLRGFVSNKFFFLCDVMRV